MEKTLKEQILYFIENSNKGCAMQLAQISGSYSSGSNLVKVLRDPKKSFENLNALINIVRFIFGDEEKKLMEQYSTEIDVNTKSARHMLEYLSSNRLLDSMKILIDKMLVCKNKDSREYARVYSFQLEWYKNYYDLDVQSFIKSVNEVKTTLNELNIYLYLLKFYGSYHTQNYKLAYEFSKVIGNSVNEIKDDYIKNNYKIRYNEALSYIYLRVLNKPEESRKNSRLVLESNAALGFVSYAHYNIGCSYMCSSYDNALEHLNKSIELYKSVNRMSVVKDLKEKIDLLNVIWDKNEDIYTITPKLLQEAKRGKLQISSLMKFKDEIDLSFYYLIKGIKENDNELLLLSLIEFIKTGDTYLGNLPKIELLKRGYNKEIISAITSMNQY